MFNLQMNPSNHPDIYEIERAIGAMQEGELREWLRGLSDVELIAKHAVRYHPIYLNLLSVFSGTMSVPEIRRIAAQCTRTAIWTNRVLDRLLATLPDAALRESGRANRLRGLDSAFLSSLISPRCGLIVCSYRVGHYSLLPLEIALNGFRVSWPVKDDILPSFDETIRGLRDRLQSLDGRTTPDGVDLGNALLLHALPVRSNGTSLRLAHALASGQIVMMQADGTGGAGPSATGRNRVAIDFMGLPIRVKTGTARLSWSMGAPILPSVALMDGMDAGEVVFGKPIRPPKRRSGADQDRYVQDTMEELFGFLAHYASRYPEQWPGVASVHRWRAPGPVGSSVPHSSATVDETKRLIDQELTAGCRYRIREASGIGIISSGRNWLLVDIKSMRSFQAPEWASPLFQRMSQDEGLDRIFLDAWQAQLGETSQRDPLHLLADLRRRDLISIY